MKLLEIKAPGSIHWNQQRFGTKVLEDRIADAWDFQEVIVNDDLNELKDFRELVMNAYGKQVETIPPMKPNGRIGTNMQGWVFNDSSGCTFIFVRSPTTHSQWSYIEPPAEITADLANDIMPAKVIDGVLTSALQRYEDLLKSYR